MDVAPDEPLKARPARAVTAAGENISKAEFDELVRDLDIDSPAPARDPAADLEPEEVVMPGQPAGQPTSRAKQRRARNRRHGRSH